MLRKALEMKGQESVASELSPEISPTWPIESDSAEWQFLKAVRIVSASGSIAPVAAQLPRFQLVNPPTSGMVAIVSAVNVSGNIGATWSLRLIQTTLAVLTTVLEAGPRDTRWAVGGPTVSPVIASGESNVAAIAGGFLIATRRVLAATSMRFEEPVVLTPGSTLFWGATANNFTAEAEVHWRERQIPALEL